MRLITIVSDRAEDVVIQSEAQRRAMYRVSSLMDLRSTLSQIADGDEPTSLDLAGHSTRDAKLLKLGATVVDLCRPSVAALFDDLSTSGELERLCIVSVRLLGCETAVEPAGQLTMKLLATMLALPVFGARREVMKCHYNDRGFDPSFTRILVEAAQLPNPPRRLTW